MKVKHKGVTSIIMIINNITGTIYIMSGVYNFDKSHSRWALKSFFFTALEWKLLFSAWSRRKLRIINKMLRFGFASDCSRVFWNGNKIVLYIIQQSKVTV